jgi:hypothetical protein
LVAWSGALSKINESLLTEEGEAVGGAILFPLFLGFVAIIFEFTLMVGEEFEASMPLPMLLMIGVVVVQAAFFGWVYFRGLNKGRKATPPVYHVRERFAFAVALTCATAGVLYIAVELIQENLGHLSASHLTSYRMGLLSEESEVRQLELNRPDSPTLADRKHVVAVRKAHLAWMETGKARVAGCIFLAALFALGSGAAWENAVRARTAAALTRMRD